MPAPVRAMWAIGRASHRWAAGLLVLVSPAAVACGDMSCGSGVLV